MAQNLTDARFITSKEGYFSTIDIYEINGHIVVVAGYRNGDVAITTVC